LGDLDPEHQQFAVDPRCSPQGVLLAHPSDLAVDPPAATTTPDASGHSECDHRGEARDRDPTAKAQLSGLLTLEIVPVQPDEEQTKSMFRSRIRDCD
jgi:hypothetical protein